MRAAKPLRSSLVAIAITAVRAAVRGTDRLQGRLKPTLWKRELRHLVEMVGSSANLRSLQCAQAVETELLYRKAAHHGPVDHRPPKFSVIGSFHAGQVAHEAARERITCPGRVVNLLQGKRGHAECAVLMDKHGSVLASLDDQRFRAEFENVPCGKEQVVFIG